MVRTRFILDWYADYGTKFPFKLFELQRQLLQEGMFDAYNQWIFTAAQNLPAYQNWISVNAGQYNELARFQKGRIFKIPAGNSSLTDSVSVAMIAILELVGSHLKYIVLRHS